MLQLAHVQCRLPTTFCSARLQAQATASCGVLGHVHVWQPTCQAGSSCSATSTSTKMLSWLMATLANDTRALPLAGLAAPVYVCVCVGRGGEQHAPDQGMHARLWTLLSTNSRLSATLYAITRGGLGPFQSPISNTRHEGEPWGSVWRLTWTGAGSIRRCVVLQQLQEGSLSRLAGALGSCLLLHVLQWVSTGPAAAILQLTVASQKQLQLIAVLPPPLADIRVLYSS